MHSGSMLTQRSQGDNVTVEHHLYVNGALELPVPEKTVPAELSVQPES